jgi:hypothetical protein
MQASDRDGLLALARSIPEHDQLFLRRDITRPEVVDRWIAELGGRARDRARRERGYDRRLRHRAAGPTPGRRTSPSCACIARRDRGLGTSSQEAFARAPRDQKITARMTPDQRSALRSRLGFRAEGCCAYVKDRNGQLHDLLVLSHDAARFHAMLDAYGVVDALGE